MAKFLLPPPILRHPHRRAIDLLQNYRAPPSALVNQRVNLTFHFPLLGSIALNRDPFGSRKSGKTMKLQNAIP